MAIIIGAVIVAFVCLIAGLLWMTRRRPPDDAVAVSLAAELGGTRPTLLKTDAGWAWEWCFEVDLEGRLRVFVHEHGIRVRRVLSAPLGDAARILTRPLFGRAQEDYGFARTLVPAEGGTFVVGGRPSEHLVGWELRVGPRLLEELARLEVSWLGVELDGIETGCREQRGASWVRDVATFLRDTERTLRGE